MALVPRDQELEDLEEEERQLDLEIAKQEKMRQILAKKQELHDLSVATGNLAAAAAPPEGNPATAAPTVTRTATLTIKKGTYHEHSESTTTQKDKGISLKMKDVGVGYKEGSTNSAQIQWKKSEEIQGSMPFNLDQGSGQSGSVEPTQAFLAAMGITAEQINAIKYK